MIVFIAYKNDNHYCVLIEGENQELHHQDLYDVFTDLGYKIVSSNKDTWFQYCYINKPNYNSLIINDSNEINKVKTYVRKHARV